MVWVHVSNLNTKRRLLADLAFRVSLAFVGGFDPLSPGLAPAEGVQQELAGFPAVADARAQLAQYLEVQQQLPGVVSGI
jgi:hypothetical protein